MTLGAPLGLLALLAVPAIVALHLFRDRLPERRVAALFLFPVAPTHAPSGRTRTRRWRSASLWLECLAALAAAAWLAEPSFGALRRRHLVVVLDDSASMAAIGTQARALAAVRRAVEQLGARDRVTLVTSGTPPTVRLGPRAECAALDAALASWRPCRAHHPLAPTLALARELAGRSGDLLLVSDTTPAEAVDDVRVIGCGERRANAALTGIARRRTASGERLVVTAVAHGDIGTTELRVRSGQRELLRAPLSFPPEGGDAQLAVPLPDVAADAVLCAELAGDALPLDDVVCSVPAAARIVGITDELPRELHERLAIDRVLAAQHDWRPEPIAARAQLLLREAPGEVAAGQLELVVAPSAGERRGHVSPFVVDRTSPLLAGMPLRGLAWAAGSGDVAGRVLVAAGAKVLLAEQWLAAGRRVVIDLDPSAGNVVRAPDWPILFANVLDACRADAPGVSATDVQLAQPVQYRGADVDEPVRVEDPGGREVAIGERGAVQFTPDAPGVWTVRGADGALRARVAVRFVDTVESDLSRTAAFDQAARVAPAPAAAAADERGSVRGILAVLLLLFVLADWWHLGRRAS